MAGTLGNRRVSLRIRGQVQGVCYRRAAQSEAQRLGLAGWVRNESDGSVYAEAQGRDEAVETFVRWCRRGPSAARVEAVEVEELPAQPGPDDFHIRPAG